MLGRLTDIEFEQRQAQRREATIELRANGLGNRKIGKILGVDESTIRRVAAPNGAVETSETAENGQSNDAGAPFGAPRDPASDARAANAEQLAAIKARPTMRAGGKYSCLVVDPPWPRTAKAGAVVAWPRPWLPIMASAPCRSAA